MLFEFKRMTKTKCRVIFRESEDEPITTDTIAIHSETSRVKFLKHLAAKHALSIDEIEPDFRSAYQQFVASGEEEERLRSDNIYKIDERRYVHSESGRVISNFTAEVLEEIILDDGFETSRIFVIEGDLSDGTELRQIQIPAEQFAGMEWVSPSWGVKAIIEAGVGNKDHMRAAIQHFSPHPGQRIVYGHTGWRDHNDAMVYLHAGGAIGGEGAVADIETLLPVQLRPFILPDPPHGAELVMAIHASLQIRDLAAGRIAVPLLGSIFRAPLGNVEFTTFLFGITGGGKSSLAALVQQHFSPTSDRANLPANFSSTANANETLASIAKDAILVVDEFVPNGSVVQQQTAHQQADRLIRAQGNGAGRQRLSRDGLLRPQRPPRCLIVATGEVTPHQQSALARLVMVEVQPGDLDLELLTQAQERARNGMYAACMAGYLQWLAPRIREIQRNWEPEIQSILAELQFDRAHSRTPINCANLLLALHYFLRFAVDVGAITREQSDTLSEEFAVAIRDVARAQRDELEGVDPVTQSWHRLRDLIRLGRVHLENVTGGIPLRANEVGWRQSSPTSRFETSQGSIMVGWADADFMYLVPDRIIEALRLAAMAAGENFTFTVRTIARDFAHRGIAVPEPGQNNLFRLRTGQFSDRSDPPRVLRIRRQQPAARPAAQPAVVGMTEPSVAVRPLTSPATITRQIPPTRPRRA